MSNTPREVFRDTTLDLPIPYFEDIGWIDIDQNVHLHELTWYCTRYIDGMLQTHISPKAHHITLPELSVPCPFFGPSSAYEPLSIVVETLCLDPAFYWIAFSDTQDDPRIMDIADRQANLEMTHRLRAPVKFVSQTFAKVTQAPRVFNVRDTSKSAVHYRMLTMVVFKRSMYASDEIADMDAEKKIARLSDYRSTP